MRLMTLLFFVIALVSGFLVVLANGHLPSYALGFCIACGLCTVFERN